MKTLEENKLMIQKNISDLPQINHNNNQSDYMQNFKVFIVSL